MNRSLIGRVLTGRDRLPEVRYLGHEPGPASHLIDPVFDQARCRCAVSFLAHPWLFLRRERTAVHQSRPPIDNEVVLDDDPFLPAFHDYENAPLDGECPLCFGIDLPMSAPLIPKVSTDPNF